MRTHWRGVPADAVFRPVLVDGRLAGVRAARIGRLRRPRLSLAVTIAAGGVPWSRLAAVLPDAGVCVLAAVVLLWLTSFSTGASAGFSWPRPAGALGRRRRLSVSPCVHLLRLLLPVAAGSGTGWRPAVSRGCRSRPALSAFGCRLLPVVCPAVGCGVPRGPGPSVGCRRPRSWPTALGGASPPTRRSSGRTRRPTTNLVRGARGATNGSPSPVPPRLNRHPGGRPYAFSAEPIHAERRGRGQPRGRAGVGGQPDRRVAATVGRWPLARSGKPTSPSTTRFRRSIRSRSGLSDSSVRHPALGGHLQQRTIGDEDAPRAEGVEPTCGGWPSRISRSRPGARRASVPKMLTVPSEDDHVPWARSPR